MTHRSLEDKLLSAGSPVKMARSTPMRSFVNFRVPHEYSTWREEQIAWREAAALLDLTHHMTDLSIEGPDAVKLFSDLGINSFKGFVPGKAKQFVCCNPDGYVIGDGILFFLGPNKLSLLGLPAAHNWVQYHAESGRYDVKVQREEPTLVNPTATRKLYRYQVQGPRALDVLRKASAGSLPDIKFFNIGDFTIAGKQLRGLRHGMAGAPGLELFGPWDDGEVVRAALLEAGQEFDLKQVGMRAYPSTTLESGWIPGPLPAVFTGEELKPYQQWRPANGLEGMGSLGGSFVSDDISDYYLTPQELGYGPFIQFDHEFIGRQALETRRTASSRRKVTLVWSADDVAAAMRTMFEPGRPAKYLDLPWVHCAMWHYDKVLKDGNLVGLSTRCGYSYNERAMLSLAMVEEKIPVGAEVTVVWGDESRDSKGKSSGYAQIGIRATVAPCPYAEATRSSYADGWRTRAVAPA